MRIGLNATCLSDRPSGARQRFLGIYRALTRQRPDIEFFVYEPQGCPIARELGSPGNVIARPTPVTTGGSVSRLLSGLGYWSRQLARDRLDLFECFNMPIVRAPACPTILTIHDARHIHDSVHWPRRSINRMIWRHALSAAAHVVTVSETMREEITAFAPEADVTTIYNGVDAAPFERARPCKTDQPYLLTVGHLEPRKNYETLIDAIAILRQRQRTIPLVIVGRDGGSLEQLSARIAFRAVCELVTIRQDVDDAALASLYRGAMAVVFPSLYEGFGIPLIETIAAQRPLLVSDIPVFRELTQGSALFFDPSSSTAITDTVLRVADDTHLADTLIAHGRKRIPDFAFETLATQVSALYARVLRQRCAEPAA